MKKAVNINNERDLHVKVVDCIKKKFPDLIVVPGLGELQDTATKRFEACYKGYRGGQPDLLILNPAKHFSGFAIEFKSPSGKWNVSDKQEEWINKLAALKYKTMVSDDYDAILIELTQYYMLLHDKTA